MKRLLPVVAGIVGVALAVVLWRGVPAGLEMEPPLIDEGDPFDPDYDPEAERVRTDARPNVIVVVWDTVRADHLSLYGYPRPTTPNLDRLAGNAMVFEQAHAPGVWTLPSHASMFTGLPPESTGADERWMWLDTPHLTLAEHFQGQGYNTISLAANTLLSTDTNLTQGFHVPINSFRGRLAASAKQATDAKLLPGDVSQELAPGWKPPAHGATNAEWARAAYKEAGPLLISSLLQWTEQRQRPDTPFFAYVNLMEAHTPRLPSIGSRRRVLAADPELVELGLQVDAGHINLHFYNFGKHTYTPRELEAIVGVYDAALADLDQTLQPLFDGLERRGLLANTYIVLTSDHGENLGDHGLFNHRFTLAESLTHVPLVVWGPNIQPGRVNTPVSTMDLFPTLCDWAGVPVPDHLAGHHWLRAPRPAVTRMELPLRREIETVQSVHADVSIEPWLRSGHAMLGSGGLKVLRWDQGPSYQAFDLGADPTEAAPSEPTADRVAALDAWIASVPPYDPSRRTPADDPVHVRASQEELRENLEALGYVTPE